MSDQTKTVWKLDLAHGLWSLHASIPKSQLFFEEINVKKKKVFIFIIPNAFFSLLQM